MHRRRMRRRLGRGGAVFFAFDPRERLLHGARGATGDRGARLAAWIAVLRGEYAVEQHAARQGEDVYLFVERAARPLSATEAAAATAAAHAHAGKLIAHDIGVAPSTVSMALASAASKIGLASAIELARLARALVTEADVLDASALTAAEREVLALLVAGKSNREIAAARRRSVRTVANQVASILRKTGACSRASLRVQS